MHNDFIGQLFKIMRIEYQAKYITLIQIKWYKKRREKNKLHQQNQIIKRFIYHQQKHILSLWSSRNKCLPKRIIILWFLFLFSLNICLISKINRYYRKSDLPKKFDHILDCISDNEIFETDHLDITFIDCINGPCKLYSFTDYDNLNSISQNTFFTR